MSINAIVAAHIVMQWLLLLVTLLLLLQLLTPIEGSSTRVDPTTVDGTAVGCCELHLLMPDVVVEDK
jgi:hypothetical protein